MLNGEAPKSIERFFNVTCNAKVNWRDELRHAIDKYAKDDYTLIPPSKKLLYQGIYLPSNISITFKLVIAIDSSGSIDDELLNTFLSEVDFLMQMVPNYQIDMLVCDEKIHTHKTFYTGDTLDIKVVGYGATDFRPVFEYVDANLDDVQLLLYFTDLDGFFPKESPSFEVKWVSQKEKTIPFGSLILLED
jgi:predicted metal-dependent peptidase